MRPFWELAAHVRRVAQTRVDVGDALRLDARSPRTEIDRVRLRIVGVVAVHAGGGPAGAVEVAAREDRAGGQQEHVFAVPAIGEPDAELAQLRFRKAAPVGKARAKLCDASSLTRRA